MGYAGGWGGGGVGLANQADAYALTLKPGSSL